MGAAPERAQFLDVALDPRVARSKEIARIQQLRENHQNDSLHCLATDLQVGTDMEVAQVPEEVLAKAGALS